MSFNVKGLPFNYKGVVDVSDCETAADVIKKQDLIGKLVNVILWVKCQLILMKI